MFVSEWGPSEGGRMAAFRQSLSEDHTFLKVLGKCHSQAVLLCAPLRHSTDEIPLSLSQF